MSGLVFFGGGSAQAALAAEFAARGEGPAWIITTFDSGGSTQALRRVLDMPAVGDLRNRLLAMTDGKSCSPRIISFLRTRVPADRSGAEALAALRRIIANPDWHSESGADLIAEDLDRFLSGLPDGFNAARASIGNLALTGAWLKSANMGAAVARYARLLGVRGKVIPVCEQPLHLGIELANKSTLLGQHLLHTQLPAPVERIFLTASSPWRQGEVCPVSAVATEAALQAIRAADLICFGPGSFYSSLLVTLLPRGLGEAIALSACRKVFIPNTGIDPEISGLSLQNQVERMLAVLRKDAPDAARQQLLDFVLIDSARGQYPHFHNQGSGAPLLDAPVVSRAGRHDPSALRSILLDLACGRS